MSQKVKYMKVTALISDDLISEVQLLSGGKNITESITLALKEWVAQKKIQEVTNIVVAEPLTFYGSYSAETVRNLNRETDKNSL